MGVVVEMGERLHVVRDRWQAARDQDRQQERRRQAASRANAARQRALRERRTVAWANRDLIAAFYEEAQRLTRETGVPHEVDHVIPLLGRHVSGLHVETNLQVIPMEANRRKSNSTSAVITPGITPAGDAGNDSGPEGPLSA